MEQERLRGATPCPRRGRKELLQAQGQGRLEKGATSSPSSWVVAKRSYPTSKVRSVGHEEIPHVQVKEQQLRFAGAAMKRYPTYKVRETQVRR